MKNHSTYFTPFSSVSIVDFEQVNVSWVITSHIHLKHRNIGTRVNIVLGSVCYLFELYRISCPEVYCKKDVL